MHGRNGVGRLTFFTFANSATWTTSFKTHKGFQQGQIHINTGELNGYSHDFSQAPTRKGDTGTRVAFTNLKISKEDMELSIIPFLINEFCWFIELNKHKGYEILVKPELIAVIKALYETEPKLFSGLNIDQKKTLIRFLDRLLISNERKNIFGLLNEVLALELEESESLAELLAPVDAK